MGVFMLGYCVIYIGRYGGGGWMWKDVQFPSTVSELGARLADMEMENLGDTHQSASNSDSNH